MQQSRSKYIKVAWTSELDAQKSNHGVGVAGVFAQRIRGWACSS